LCFCLSWWNAVDSILKERLFGLTNAEGNHGEDVKEYYFYLDSTPTHSYMKYLYKYPQTAFPYADLVKTNAQRSREEPEYELIDTGVFADDLYFDLFVEYAKASPEDILIRVTAFNRGDQEATLHTLPQLWFRNTWRSVDGKRIAEPPVLRLSATPNGECLEALHPRIGTFYLYSESDCDLLFTENETNAKRVFGRPNLNPYLKDAFHRYVINLETDCVNPAKTGTKVAFYSKAKMPAGSQTVLRFRLTRSTPDAAGELFGDGFDEIFDKRIHEADEFYASIEPSAISTDERRVMRQALAGMLWTKQYYYFDLERWLQEHGMTLTLRKGIRNAEWLHMVNDDIISMPDKWEYPWFAAWDLAFHCVALAMVDMELAKSQLLLMLHEMYQHPNGQMPAYEWNFGDVNPPVHAWAVLFVFLTEKQLNGTADLRFLKLAFHKLLMNFTWWVNRKDREGRNVFECGFLGLDNIGIFDRSSPLPTGGFLEQADGTAWMASSVNRCCRLRWSSRLPIPCTRTWRRSSSSTSSGLRARWIASA
jgi:Mannosylglycerate hydrolase MGH1-like glycoside hydrolase domain